MNLVNTLLRVLRGGSMIGEEEQFLYRLDKADNTNDRLEARIIELAEGKSVAKILRTLTEGLDEVWAARYREDAHDAIQKLEKKGFIRLEKRTNGQAYAINKRSNADVHL